MNPDVIRKYVEDARARVRSSTEQLTSGSETLDRVATELELAARIWGQDVHHAVLNDLALDGVAPPEFEKRAAESAEEIAVMAAELFSVRCGRGASTRKTPVLIGQTAGVIDTNHALDIDTRQGIRTYLEKLLAEYPGQYRRQNLSVYKLTRGIRGDLGGPLGGVKAGRHPSSGIRKQRRRGKPDPVVARIKKKVRELRAAHLDYSSICERLGSSERPPRAKWRDLSWPVAYRKHKSAVTKWLSEACSDNQS
jgi:hypothetical protein